MKGNDFRAAHDLLLANKPEGAEHDEADCSICQEADAGESTEKVVEHVSEETFTQEQLDSAVAEATAELQAQLASLREEAGVAELDKAVAEATAEQSAKIDELQEKLDAAVLEAQEAKEQHAELEKFWAEEIAKAEEAEAAAARLESRLAEVKAEVDFPESYLDDAFEARLVAMSDEDFETRLAEWKLLKAAKTEEIEEEIPEETVLTSSREESAPASALKGLADIAQAKAATRVL